MRKLYHRTREDLSLLYACKLDELPVLIVDKQTLEYQQVPHLHAYSLAFSDALTSPSSPPPHFLVIIMKES